MSAMTLSLKPHSLKRYAAIARLLIKYGREDWVRSMGLDASLAEAGSVAATNHQTGSNDDKADQLADDLESMGPTFVKLGQLLSSRSDLLPQPYLEALSRLQDDVEPFPGDQVEHIVSSELGVRLSRGFSEFDLRPLAAASLGQVHRAKLRDGRRVVVKVQRPGVREIVLQDLAALEGVAEFLDHHTEMGKSRGFVLQLEELRRSLLNELDYRLEARNLVTLGANLRDFKNIVVPRPIEDYCSSLVLTMDHISGAKVTDLSPVVLIDADGPGLTREVFDAYLKQILVDGFFHADPHPGNVLLTDDHRLALLDLGMVAHLTPELQQRVLKLLLAISEGRGEDAADEAIGMGTQLDDFDRHTFRRTVAEFIAQHGDKQVQDLHVGRMVLEIQRISGDNGFRLPSPFTMIGKMLLNLDRIASVLDQKFDPNAAIRENALALMQSRMRKNVSLGSVFNFILETSEFLQRLPQRLNGALDAVTGKELRVRVEAIDEAYFLKGLHKIANRITTGLVLAALIVGAALLARVETTFKVWGYPVLAIVLFTGAAAGGVILVVRSLWQESRHEQEVSHPGRPGKR
jgi:predicted unusual protein kinase regulating ubiquinone biosynthesis (AarF/ABC1/UbiB family)